MAGYICVVSWEGDRSRVRFGYSPDIKASLEALSEAHWQRLLVRKIIAAPTGPGTLDELTSKFFELRVRGFWFRLDTTIRSMLQSLSDSTTYELEAELASASVIFDVIANPNEVSPYRTRKMANGIKQCRHYILWMINECQQADIRVNPKLLIDHPANDGRFKEKTIYNELSAMRRRAFLSSDRDRGESLTLFGRRELERLNTEIALG